jgi:type I restriction enzyme R subunit
LRGTSLRRPGHSSSALDGHLGLRDGIDDGFLAPYRVHRIVPSVDAAGWRPTKGELDRYGREIPDQEYGTKDFERSLVFKRRTEAIARHLTDFLERTDPFAKTIVFCVDQEHAGDMRRTLNNLNAERARQYPDYVCRVTADEGAIGGGHLSRFQELETVSPVILTTSQLLTTGVDAPTCKNVVIARVIGSMTDFKQRSDAVRVSARTTASSSSTSSTTPAAPLACSPIPSSTASPP